MSIIDIFIVNYSYINPFIYFSSSIIILFLLGIMVYNLRNNKYKSNFFLAFAVLSLGTANILQLLFCFNFSYSGLPSFFIQLFKYSIAILSSLLVLFFLLLFFRTFESEIIMNKLEMFLSGFLILLSSSMFSTIFLLSSIFSTGPKFSPPQSSTSNISTVATSSPRQHHKLEILV